jgi:hypothetical protein
MKALSSITAFMAVVAVSWPASAATGLLHVTCAWRKSTDMKTFESRPLTGQVDFFYDPISDLTGTMRKDGFDPSFVASTRDNLIEGIAHYEADGSAAEQRVEINRYTGAIMNWIKTVKGAEVLEGTCTRISGPDFGQGPAGE